MFDGVSWSDFEVWQHAEGHLPLQPPISTFFFSMPAAVEPRMKPASRRRACTSAKAAIAGGMSTVRVWAQFRVVRGIGLSLDELRCHCCPSSLPHLTRRCDLSRCSAAAALRRDVKRLSLSPYRKRWPHCLVFSLAPPRPPLVLP